MSLSNLFVCDNCGCVDDLTVTSQTTPGRYECHECKHGVWHQYFPKQQYVEGVDDVVNRAGYGIRPSFS